MQKGNTNGVGMSGGIGDNTKTLIPWNAVYCTSFEIKVPEKVTLVTDANVWDVNEKELTCSTTNNTVSNAYVILDNKTYNGYSVQIELTPNTWHKVEMYFTNGHSNNTSHATLKSYNTIGLLLTNKNTTTYQIRNITSRVVN